MNQLNIEKLVIHDLVYRKVMHWVQKATGEVSGLGCVEMQNGIPHVTEVFLLEQENTGTSTDLDAAAVAKLMNDHRDKDFRWWWHSHANMGVFWSGTDNATIKEFGGNGWLTATVFNKQQLCKSAVYTRATVASEITGEVKQMDIFLDDVKTEVMRPEVPELIAQWDAEYDAKCKTKVYSYQGNLALSGSWERKKQHPLWDEWHKSPSGNWEEWLRIEGATALREGNLLRHRQCKWFTGYLDQNKNWKEYYEERLATDGVVELSPPKAITEDWVSECEADIKALIEMGLPYGEIKRSIEEDWGVNWVSLVDEAFNFGDMGYGII